MRASALLAVGLLAQVWADRTMRPVDHATRDTTLQGTAPGDAANSLRPVALGDRTTSLDANMGLPGGSVSAARDDGGPTDVERTPVNVRVPVEPFSSAQPDWSRKTSSRRSSSESTGGARTFDIGPARAKSSVAPLPVLLSPVASRPPTAVGSGREIRLELVSEPIAPLEAAALPLPAAVAPAEHPHHREAITIRRVIQEYATALGHLDPIAAKRVWPSIDEHALARAFRGLQAQSLTFAECGVTLEGALAQASCLGRATYLPKVGRRRPLSTTGEWRFNLARTDSAWVIQSAAVR